MMLFLWSKLTRRSAMFAPGRSALMPREMEGPDEEFGKRTAEQTSLGNYSQHEDFPAEQFRNLLQDDLPRGC